MLSAAAMFSTITVLCFCIACIARTGAGIHLKIDRTPFLYPVSLAISVVVVRANVVPLNSVNCGWICLSYIGQAPGFTSLLSLPPLPLPLYFPHLLPFPIEDKPILIELVLLPTEFISLHLPFQQYLVVATIPSSIKLCEQLSINLHIKVYPSKDIFYLIQIRCSFRYLFILLYLRFIPIPIPIPIHLPLWIVPGGDLPYFGAYLFIDFGELCGDPPLTHCIQFINLPLRVNAGFRLCVLFGIH